LTTQLSKLFNMANAQIPSHHKKFNTELTDYSVTSRDKTGPYAENLDVDAVIVGAGFGMTENCPEPTRHIANEGAPVSQLAFSCSRRSVTGA